MMVETRVGLTAGLWAVRLVDWWVDQMVDMKEQMRVETRELK